MRMYDIIMKKRNGGELTKDEIDFFIEGYTKGDIPDYQVAALMMAIYFRKMTEAETLALTMAMADSGDRLDLSGIRGVKAWATRRPWPWLPWWPPVASPWRR